MSTVEFGVASGLLEPEGSKKLEPVVNKMGGVNPLLFSKGTETLFSLKMGALSPLWSLKISAREKVERISEILSIDEKLKEDVDEGVQEMFESCIGFSEEERSSYKSEPKSKQFSMVWGKVGELLERNGLEGSRVREELDGWNNRLRELYVISEDKAKLKLKIKALSEGDNSNEAQRLQEEVVLNNLLGKSSLDDWRLRLLSLVCETNVAQRGAEYGLGSEEARQLFVENMKHESGDVVESELGSDKMEKNVSREVSSEGEWVLLELQRIGNVDSYTLKLEDGDTLRVDVEDVNGEWDVVDG